MRRSLGALFALCLTAQEGAAADAEHCRSLTDDKARLACFDATASAAKPVAVQASPANRVDYALQIERSFLKAGQNMSVMAPEAPDKASAVAESPLDYPQLILFAYFDRPFVYKTVAETEILATARALGFKTVDFFSRNAGHWIFDVSGKGPLPRCDRVKRLCY